MLWLGLVCCCVLVSHCVWPGHDWRQWRLVTGPSSPREQRVTPGGAHQEMPGSDWLTEEILGSDWARELREAPGGESERVHLARSGEG